MKLDQAKIDAWFAAQEKRTRDEFLTSMRADYEAGGRQNGAIGRHIAEVERMTEAEFAVHNAKLNASCRAAAPELKRLAKREMRGRD